MPKVYFAATVKHNGTIYPPNTPFTVGDDEIADLKRKGCWVVAEPPTEQPVKRTARKKANDSV